MTVEARMGVGWFPRVVSVTMLTVYEPREAEGCCAVSPSEPLNEGGRQEKLVSNELHY